MPRKISVGLDLSAPQDLPIALDSAVAAGFDFVVSPLFHPRYRRDADGVSDSRDGPGTRSDLVMTSDRWSACVVGKLSPWLDLDSPVTSTRLASEKALKQEVAWASHLTGWFPLVSWRHGCENGLPRFYCNIRAAGPRLPIIFP